MIPNQAPFQQYMKAKDIAEHVNLDEAVHSEPSVPGKPKSEKQKSSEREMLSRKLTQNQSDATPGRLNSFHDDIEKNGIKEPLRIFTGPNNKGLNLVNGNHRLASQLAHDPEADVPVEIFENHQRKLPSSGGF